MNRDSVSSIAFNSNISCKTISFIINELSKIIVPKYNSKYSKIGGKNIIVEVDESKFGKRKYHKGHRVEGVWIFGMVERTKERRIHLIAVEDRTALTLNAELKAKVHEDSIIYSDCWKGYKDVFNIFAEHVKVNHSTESLLRFVEHLCGPFQVEAYNWAAELSDCHFVHA